MLRIFHAVAAFALVSGAHAALATDVAASSDDVAPSYTLGIDDKLALTVYGEEGLSGEQQVGPDGSIAVPLIGKVRAEGRTVDAVSAEVRERLAAGYLRNHECVDCHTHLSALLYSWSPIITNHSPPAPG